MSDSIIRWTSTGGWVVTRNERAESCLFFDTKFEDFHKRYADLTSVFISTILFLIVFFLNCIMKQGLAINDCMYGLWQFILSNWIASSASKFFFFFGYFGTIFNLYSVWFLMVFSSIVLFTTGRCMRDMLLLLCNNMTHFALTGASCAYTPLSYFLLRQFYDGTVSVSPDDLRNFVYLWWDTCKFVIVAVIQFLLLIDSWWSRSDIVLYHNPYTHHKTVTSSPQVQRI